MNFRRIFPFRVFIKNGGRSDRLKNYFSNLLSLADVKINGDRPWDMQVHDDALYSRVIAESSLGLGEAYMDGWWDCEALDQFFFRVLNAELNLKITNWHDMLAAARAKLFNLQKISRAFEIGQHHYDIGNDLYQRMLDTHMMYSCGYWNNAETLEQAQEAKLDLICRKLKLEPGLRLLDIGCGWGGMAAYAAKKYGVSVVGITVSHEQAEYAKRFCRDLPVSIELRDYRNIEGTFDRIVSIGMFEHVGYKNYRTFMECQQQLLAPEGLTLLHTIGGNRTVATCEKWISRYIFPNSMLPSMQQIATAAEGLFVIEDLHNFGIDYDTTLMHWFDNFDKAWPELQKHAYDQRFYRMWKYYLLSCAGSFRARKNQLWQIVMSPGGCSYGYHAPR
ncbi:cyclopropane fatty acyl phospholipid synthase [Desulforhopalus singaporensis]|uniref:Cyclopropane-fatty-acyl-phospholipid synthase n=1 Tax=Desulforhopalus singaporensis TaxID=91360 RepID=A0A1H0IWP2_9BACT|nr:cyclopropane fatty acyl phospholipid synthase [Desulforhopalus singaporensis]SDO35845.1 cyclopropane-fatty-acyl-phospholipid synthase [Desulforhopalus singaporensis]